VERDASLHCGDEQRQEIGNQEQSDPPPRPQKKTSQRTTELSRFRPFGDAAVRPELVSGHSAAAQKSMILQLLPNNPWLCEDLREPAEQETRPMVPQGWMC